MEVLIKATQTPDYPAEIILVISNRPDAAGIAKAQKLGIKTHVIDHKNFNTRKNFEREMDKCLNANDIDLICNAGFMRILTPWFVRRWLGRQLNIHPSLLPKYKGLHTHERALLAGEKKHGCTVHWVNEGIDEGEIIVQACVDILHSDTPDTLAIRVLAQEHILFPMALKQIAASIINT